MTAAAIRHTKRGTIVPVRHNGRHLVSTQEPMERFAKYLRFDPCTGCVVWTGGTTQGRGHSAPYGSFWYDKKRWFAHRWAGKFIHGLEIEGFRVDHCCPHTGGLPNTLCVEHLQALTLMENVALQHRRHWIHTQVGLFEPEPVWQPNGDDVPFYSPPAWLIAVQPQLASTIVCPF